MSNKINLINANFITLDKHCPKADSISIVNNKIAGINSIDHNFQSIDLRGATVIPGFVDSHFHLTNLGKQLDTLQLKNCKSAEEIAQKVKRIAVSIGMKIVAHDPYLQPNSKIWKGTDNLTLDELLKCSDIISLHVPLTKETKSLIDKTKMELLKPSAIIINAARGGIIDEDALASALEKGRIRGAALDVFTNEPLSNKSELFKLENAFISPHVSGNYKNYQKDMIQFFGENLNRFILGKTLKNRICKKSKKNYKKVKSRSKLHFCERKKN